MLPKGKYNSVGNKRLYVLKQPATVSWGARGGGVKIPSLKLIRIVLEA